MNLLSHPDVFHGFSNCQIWWTWAGQPRIHARSMKFRQKLEKINLSSYEIFSLLDHNEQVPFDLDKYFLRFNRKYVLHNQDEKLFSCSSMNWEKFVKIGFAQKQVCQKAILENFYKFYSLWKICWKAKSSLERKIHELSYNPHTSHKIAQTFTLTLLLSISKVQLCKWGLRGRKWGFL